MLQCSWDHLSQVEKMWWRVVNQVSTHQKLKGNKTHREAKAKKHTGITSRYCSRGLSTCPDLNHEVRNSDSGQRCPSSTNCFASEHPSTADVAFRVTILRLPTQTYQWVCHKPKAFDNHGPIYVKTFNFGPQTFLIPDPVADLPKDPLCRPASSIHQVHSFGCKGYCNKKCGWIQQAFRTSDYSWKDRSCWSWWEEPATYGVHICSLHPARIAPLLNDCRFLDGWVNCSSVAGWNRVWSTWQKIYIWEISNILCMIYVFYIMKISPITWANRRVHWLHFVQVLPINIAVIHQTHKIGLLHAKRWWHWRTRLKSFHPPLSWIIFQ